MQTKNNRARNWCFTINKDVNFQYDENEHGSLLLFDDEVVRYATWQLESGDQTHRPHVQGYIEFRNPVRMGGVKEHLGCSTAHVEPRRGSKDQAVEYCQKPEGRIAGPWEFGSRGKPGKRVDLDQLAEGLVEGTLSIQEVRRTGKYLQYRGGCETLARVAERKRAKSFRELYIVVYYGDAGSGKTRLALDVEKLLSGPIGTEIELGYGVGDDMGGLDAGEPVQGGSIFAGISGIFSGPRFLSREDEKKEDGGDESQPRQGYIDWEQAGGTQEYYILDQAERVWFDGYEGEPRLVIDDFYGWIKYGMLLRILDGHQFRGEVKGGHIYGHWTTVIITSNKRPDEWYKDGLTPALARRINEVWEFKNDKAIRIK